MPKALVVVSEGNIGVAPSDSLTEGARAQAHTLASRRGHIPSHES